MQLRIRIRNVSRGLGALNGVQGLEDQNQSIILGTSVVDPDQDPHRDGAELNPVSALVQGALNCPTLPPLVRVHFSELLV